MSFRENLETRLNYRGGKRQYDRMVADKLWSLQSAIDHSYQTASIETAQGHRFRCLFNPKKLDMDYDCNELSIPYKQIDLNSERKGKTSEGLIDIELSNGDVFTWVEDNSKWIIVLEYTEEVAYYRAKCKKCEGIAEVGDGYPVYIRGPVENKIDWINKSNTSINNLNYTLIMYITKNEETSKFFHRHKEVKIDGLPYKVEAIDWYGGDGVIQVALVEYYKTTIADEGAAVEPVPEPQVTTIIGDQEAQPYDTKIYTIDSKVEGVWKVSNKKAKIISQDATSVTVSIITSKSGSVELTYNDGDNVIDTLVITIKSL